MKKQAIGIAINGKDVKIAQLIRDNKEISISFLETITLPESLDYQANAEDADSYSEDSADEMFGGMEPEQAQGNQSDNFIAESAGLLFDALRKFSATKIKVGFNAPPSHVTYQELNTTLDYNKNAYKGTLKKKIEGWKTGFDSLENVFVLTRTDGTLCNVSLRSKTQPQILGLLLQLNSIVKNKFQLAAMMPNELALVNLARQSYHSRKGEISIIVQVEEDFARLIFMDGNDMIAISPIISDVFAENLNETLYSKIIYELDNREIVNIKRILLACRGISDETAQFFEQQFPNTSVGYIVSQPLAQNLAKEYSRNDLSEYALAIALAWQVLDSKNKAFFPANLLPKDIIKKQKPFQLNLAGAVLLLVLVGITLFLSSLILQERFAIYRTEKKIEEHKRQITANEKYIERVNELAEEIEFLKKSISISDSVGRGFDNALTFMEQVHASIGQVPNIWVNKLIKGAGSYSLQGQSFKKIAIPQISNLIGDAIIQTIARSQSEETKVLFDYEIDVAWNSNSSVFDLIDYQKPDTLLNQQDDVNEQVADLSKSDALVAKVGRVTSEAIEKVSMEAEKLSSDYADKAQHVLKAASSEQGAQGDSIVTLVLNRYDDRQLAEKDSIQMAASGYIIFVADAHNDPKGKKYWLCMGSYPSREKAMQLMSENGETALPVSEIVTVARQRSKKEQDSQSFVGGGSSRVQKPHSALPVAEYPGSTPQESQLKPQASFAPNTFSSQRNTNLTTVIRVSAHAVKVTAEHEILFLRQKGISSYYLYEPHSSSPYWVCYGTFQNVPAAAEQIKQLQKNVARQYEIISVPNDKLKNIRS